MPNKKQIFLIYSCDEWKSTDSMRLLMATTSVRRLKSYIAQQIKDGEFDYSNEESRAKQVAMFKKDFDEEPMDNINDLLVYGFYDYTHDGEEI